MTKRTLVLLALLAALWLLLSGYFFKPLLLGLGLASVGLVILVCERMDVVDQEGHPYHLRVLRVLRYWGWLLLEIVKANMDVTKRILLPGAPISPTLLRVRASQASEVGRVTYANSITLTPGTVSINVDGPWIEVHSLTREAAHALRAGEMDRRITAMEVTD